VAQPSVELRSDGLKLRRDVPSPDAELLRFGHDLARTTGGFSAA